MQPAPTLTILALLLAPSLVLALVAGAALRTSRGLRRELRRMRAELAQVEELQAIADGRKRFIAYLSHEARGLVAGILGSLQVAEQHPNRPLARPLAEALSANAQSLLDLLERSLDTAQIDAGRFHAHATPVDVLAVLERVAAEPQFTRAGSPCRAPLVQAGFARGSLWPVDGVRLAQIVRNLVSNASKYAGPAGCRICAKVVADAGGTATRLCVRVVDTGPGLTPDQRARLFAEFERVGDPSDAAGVGLGLAISRRLAQAMGGDLAVASEVGAGCTFKLRLPLQPPAQFDSLIIRPPADWIGRAFIG